MHNSSTEYDDDGSSTSISSTKAGTSGCAFRHLDIDRDVTVNNYQDDEVRPAKADVIAALIKMNEGCGEWSLQTLVNILPLIFVMEKPVQSANRCVLEIKKYSY